MAGLDTVSWFQRRNWWLDRVAQHGRGMYSLLVTSISSNIPVQGPVTEEVLFRSASVPLLLLSQTSNTAIIFLTPIIFGLAHVHHFYEFRISHPQTPVISALLRSLLQLTYTTLFGGYATFIYLRTGSLLSVILVHAFCNWMGFPRFWGRVTAGDTVMGPDVGEEKRSESGITTNSGRLSVLWTVAYYVLLCVGAVAWRKFLWQLTDSELTLTKL
jgi:prenyl protein peptidase